MKMCTALWHGDDRLRQQELEDRHSRVEYELRCLMAIPGMHFTDSHGSYYFTIASVLFAWHVCVIYIYIYTR